MCDGELCAATVRDRMEAGNRWTVLEGLPDDGLPPFDDDCVASLVEGLIPATEDSNPIVRWNTAELLRQLAVGHPSQVAAELEGILAGTDISDGRVADDLSEMLVHLAEAEPSVHDRLSVHDIKQMTGADEEGTRIRAAHLLGHHDSGDALELLLDMLSYEINGVDTAAEQAVLQRRDDAIGQLGVDDEQEDAGRSLDAVRDLRHLARHRASLITDRAERLLALLETGDGETVAEVLGWALRSEPHAPTLEALTDMLGSGADGSDQDRRRAEHALLTLEAAERASGVAEPLVADCEEWITTGDADAREHALTQLGTLAQSVPDPVERQLRAMSGSRDEDIASGAMVGEVLRSLGSAKGGDALGYLQTMLVGRGDRSAVNHLIETARALMYRPEGEMVFRTPALSGVTTGTLEDIHGADPTEGALPIVWPTFEPAQMVLLAVELLLDGLEEGSDVVVFSPGSGNHWGNKTEIRDEYARYGVEVELDRSTETVSLPDIVPHAYVTGSGVETDSGGEAASRLIIIKRLAELEEVEDPDHILMNLSARNKEAFESAIDEAIDRHEDATIVPLYSNMTKHEFENRAPRYGPPSDLEEVRTLPSVGALETAVADAGELPATDTDRIGRTDILLDGMLEPAPVSVIGVDDHGLLDRLEPGFEASADLRDEGQRRVSGRVFSKLMTIERFPLPVEAYESWVYEQRRGGGLYGPRTLESTIASLKSYAGGIEATSVATRVFRAVEYLEYGRDRLLESNPMFDALCGRIERAIGAGETVAVFMPKATWRQAVRDILLDQDVIDASMLAEGRVQLLKPDSARTADSCDELIVVGPQRPQYSFIYLLPQVGRTTVLTYRGEWDWMIDDNAQGYVDRLNEAVAGLDYEPYVEPTMEMVPVADPSWTPEPEDERMGVLDDVEPDAADIRSENVVRETVERGQRQAGRGSYQDRRDLADLFAMSGDADYGTEADGRYGQQRRREFEIETAGGETFDRRSRVLRRRSTSSSRDGHHWVSPASLSGGDTVAIIEDETFRDLWDEWLTETYTESLGDTDAFDHLRSWHDMLSTILEETMEVNEAASATDPAVKRSILARSVGIDRGDQTIWNWFESVSGADVPLELAQDPDLTMGPRRAADIHAIAEAFDHEGIGEREALMIGEGLNRIRGANSSQGHEFRQSIRDDLDDEGENAVTEATEWFEVAEVTGE
jgi:hypothetical protein